MAADSVRYATWAEELRASNFDLAGWLAVNPGPRLLHSGFVVLVAFLQGIAGARWAAALVLLNLICNALTAAVATDVTVRLTRSRFAGAGVLFLYACCFEIFLWVGYALADTTFFFFATLFWLAMLDTVTRDRIGSLRYPALAAAIALALCYRPSSLALIVVAAALPLLRLDPAPFRRKALAAFAIMLIAVTFLHAALLRNPGSWPFALFRQTVFKFADEYARGEVVIGRPETAIAGVDTIGEVMLVSGARFVRFFQFASSGYSGAHNAVNVVVFTILYSLFVAAMAMLAREKLSAREALAMKLSIVWVLAFATLHALTQLDFDWRYRLPAMTPLLVGAGIGLAALLARGRRVSSVELPSGAPPSTSR